MNTIRALLRQGKRDAAIASRRQLAPNGVFSAEATASEPHALSGTSSRRLWEEFLPPLRCCERERRSTEARLRRFQKICDAVNEAHKWGGIHLDIKPANIMVTLEGEPKLLDFGIASITRPLDPTTRSTAGHGSIISLREPGAAPQRARLDRKRRLQARGVPYELLTGSRARRSAAKEFDAVARATSGVVADTERPRLAELQKFGTGNADSQLCALPAGLQRESRVSTEGQSGQRQVLD